MEQLIKEIDKISLSSSDTYITLEDLNFDRENIHLVDLVAVDTDTNSLSNLKSAFEEINKSEIIGLDSEWVKSKGPIKTLIFQIATRNKAFIFDLQPQRFDDFLKRNVKVNHSLFNEQFESLLDATLRNEKILKVAWDFDLDLKNINNKFHPNRKLSLVNNFIDLMRIAPSSIEKGFSNHCKYYLNKGLDKTCQCSAWDHRPLTEDKLVYAAIDAISVIHVYDKMSVKVDKMEKVLELDHVEARMKKYREIKSKFDKWEV